MCVCVCLCLKHMLVFCVCIICTEDRFTFHVSINLNILRFLLISAVFMSLLESVLMSDMDPLKSAALATMVATNWNKRSRLQKTSIEESQMQTQSVLHGKTLSPCCPALVSCGYLASSVMLKFDHFSIVQKK